VRRSGRAVGPVSARAEGRPPARTPRAALVLAFLHQHVESEAQKQEVWDQTRGRAPSRAPPAEDARSSMKCVRVRALFCSAHRVRRLAQDRVVSIQAQGVRVRSHAMQLVSVS
jgi:hypothetical protein